ncbi:hypothetical protein Poli38472_010375 [Pythium oligandrum]|uniref:phosphatidylinositol-3,5-bisphosphate 3-phosphatase n=1 Tax=Pythium oligandrum TaxID=41045 RepID=A0A8K1C344_PYTOL|nr:hypothetical protein Poli38472_010375 [Pythium oligandrum]|eukprot:TMW55493.1 hypothetical protein Poli38472_010375 [Pythium oligandrum]
MLFKVVRAENLPASDLNGKSDPFVKVYYDGKEVASSPRVKRNLNPRWDYEVSIPLVHAGWMYVIVEIWDRDELSSNDLLGALRVPFPDWRKHVDEYQRRLQRLESKQQPPPPPNEPMAKTIHVRNLHSVNHAVSMDTIGEMALSSPSPNAGAHTNSAGRGNSKRLSQEASHRRSRSLNSFGGILRAQDDISIGTTSSSPLSNVLGFGRASSASTVTPPLSKNGIAIMDPMSPVLVWSSLVKGSNQGRVLCSIQYEERDLKYFINQPYGTSIYDVYLPQNPRFQQVYCHLPRSWHPDLNVRQQELSAMHAGTPKDCIFPWHEKLLHMIEEVTVTFHVNESNQGVLATLVLTNYRIWFVPYRRVRGLVHEDVHTVSIGKILKASISQQKRGSNNNTVTILELENMDAGHYNVTLSPISRLRDSVRAFSREAEAKRIKQLHNIVAEIEWLKYENTFCAPYDLNHHVISSPDEQVPEPPRVSSPTISSATTSKPPILSRAATTQFNPDEHAHVVNNFVIPDPPKTATGVTDTPDKPPVLQHHVSASSMLVTSPVGQTGAKSTKRGGHFSARRRIRYDAESEFRRQGVLDHPRWRICRANENYELCASYPSFLMMPTGLSDKIIRDAASFRSKNRLPALTWVHPRTGAPLCRSSQPNTGVFGSTNSNDRDLIWSIRDAAITIEAAIQSSHALPKKSSVLHIVDARPEINAKSNALAGKGHESVKQYDRDGVPTTSITFMGIDNIHAVRNSFVGLTQALYEVEDSNFFGAVQKSHWLEYVCSILQGASEVANHLERGDAVVVHCSDGWDRTAQLSSLAQLMLDPYFRTLEGFAILVEKDWCSFGHMFKKRCGHPTSDQTSPIFQQFLDAVYQLTVQFPTHFQFNELFLSSISEAVYSSWYGTFQMNSERDRRAFLVNVPSVSIWDVIRASTDQYLNPLFNGGDGYGDGSGGARMEPMLPVCRVRMMQLWCSQYQKAISHMRVQQRELEMLQLIRQQETELSRVYAVMNADQRLELRAIQLRADIASLARSMNLDYPEDDRSSNGARSGDDAPSSMPIPGGPGKRGTAVSVDFHDLKSVAVTGEVLVEAASYEVSFRHGSNSSMDGSVSSPISGPSSANVTSSTMPPNPGHLGAGGRRKSVTGRSRSNSLRIKNSILQMMGHLGGGSSHEREGTIQEHPQGAVNRSPSRNHHHGHHRHDISKKEVQQLESRLAKLKNQVAAKEESGRQMMRRFRCYNYNLPESALGDSNDGVSPTNSTGKSRQHRGNERKSGSRPTRYNSPSAFSPSSSSSRDSPSPSSNRRSIPTGRDDQNRPFTPGSAPLLTTTKVISGAGSFRNAQPVWERDVDAPCCKRCKKKFKTFYRNRHHCRCCGYVFCGRCTSNRMNLPEFGYYDVVRVCVTCYNSDDG